MWTVGVRVRVVPGNMIQFDVVPNIFAGVHQKLNGTESQRTPFSKLQSSYDRYSGFFGVRETYVGPISWTQV